MREAADRRACEQDGRPSAVGLRTVSSVASRSPLFATNEIHFAPLRCASPAWISRVLGDLHADHDGRQRRARHKLLGRLSEVSLCFAGRLPVVSHWLPYLIFSVPVGALNNRFDSRRIIQVGVAMFMTVSLGWGYFFATGNLQMWHAMLLLVMHGCAGVLWLTSSQVLLHDVVGQAGIESAVRLNATARYLGMLAGPGIGSLILRNLGPVQGMYLNAVFYLPLMLWLVRAPFGRRFRKATTAPPPVRAVRGIADIVETIQAARRIPVLWGMILLAGGASFFIGNSYQAQMPSFAVDLGGTAILARPIPRFWAPMLRGRSWLGYFWRAGAASFERRVRRR